MPLRSTEIKPATIASSEANLPQTQNWCNLLLWKSLGTAARSRHASSVQSWQESKLRSKVVTRQSCSLEACVPNDIFMFSGGRRSDLMNTSQILSCKPIIFIKYSLKKN